MSTPKNPLSEFSTYQMRHILAAFKYTPDAEKELLTAKSGEIGEKVNNNANSRIIVNEFSDGRFMIPTVMWTWSKSGAISKSTTSMAGNIVIADATGGQFVDWVRDHVILPLEMSSQQLTFSLKTYFTGVNRITKEYDVIQGPQLILHVHEFNDVISMTGVGTTVSIDFTAAYNTSAQIPTLAKPYQITLTNKSGELNNSAPEIFGGGGTGIMSRSKEDGLNSGPRKNRFDKSPPMKTLRDVFDAFETELNQQPFAHLAQVQGWLGNIIDDYEPKIDIPIQTRGDLPIVFHVKLDPAYADYPVDNRNLPFEQVDESINSEGISSLTFKMGLTISEMIGGLMKLSTYTGKDALNPPLDKSYKINASYIREYDDKIHIYIKIKQIILSHNSITVGDSGPGDGAIILNNATAALEFTFKSGATEDLDILYMRTSLGPDTGVIPLEHGKKSAVFGNRELQMGERIPPTAPGTEYFKSEYSGLRVPIVPNLNAALEDSVSGCDVSLTQFVTNTQSSQHEIQIYGNPYLMFDMYRQPSAAAELNSPSPANYYKIPESFPMYIKIKIFLQADAVIGLEYMDGVKDIYYYDGYYEISGIINNMTNGAFYQHLMLEKTDDII